MLPPGYHPGWQWLGLEPLGIPMGRDPGAGRWRYPLFTAGTDADTRHPRMRDLH
jgi:hypothetical protein